MGTNVFPFIMGTHASVNVLKADADTENAVKEHLRHLSLQGKSKVTIYHRQRALIRLQAALDVPLLQATPAHLYDWRASLNVTDATTAGYISQAKEFFSWCVKRHLLAESPAAEVPVPKLARRLPRPIPSADLAHALSMASGRVRPMLVLAAWCGLRAKEIALLRAENVRLRDTEPHILVASDATKGRNERVVPMSAHVIAEFVIAGLPPAQGPVFPAADGKHLKPWMISKICNEHMRACGVASTLHTLRHWCGTEAYRVDRDIRAVQELLGHANLQTTAGYAAMNRAQTAKIVNAMPDASMLTRAEAS